MTAQTKRVIGPTPYSGLYYQVAAFRGRGGPRGPILPRAHDVNDEGYAERQRDEGHDPGHAIEAGGGGRGDYGRSVFLYEALQDEVVVVALIECGKQLVAHLVGGLAADVIAFEQHLAASAGAHHAMAEVFEARGIVSGSHEEEDGGDERAGLQAAAK